MAAEKFYLKCVNFGKKKVPVLIPSNQSQKDDINVCNIILVQRDSINKSDGIELDEVAFIMSNNYSHYQNIQITLEKNPRHIQDNNIQHFTTSIQNFISELCTNGDTVRFNIIAHHYDSFECAENLLQIICQELKKSSYPNLAPEIQLISCASAQYKQDLGISYNYRESKDPVLFLNTEQEIPDERSLLKKVIDTLKKNNQNYSSVVAFNSLVVPGIFNTGIKLNNTVANCREDLPLTVEEIVNKYSPFEKKDKNVSLFESSGKLHFLPSNALLKEVYKSGGGISFLDKESFRKEIKATTPIVSVHIR